jgi:guanine nucleotide-binding protein subunit beta-2-like 1 protein
MVESSAQQHKLEYRGFMKGHGGHVTCMSVGEETVGDATREFLISGSRDKTVMIWDIVERKDTDEEKEWGIPRKVLKGHSHFVEDISLSQDSRYCLSASWDGTLRLWDVAKGTTTKRFVSHTKDVLTCAFSPCNRQIASGGRDKTVKIWNTVGDCKFTVEQNPHTDWVSSIKFYQNDKSPIVVSSSWDKTIKVWDNQTMALKYTFVGHKAQVTCMDIAPNTVFLASGGKDGLAMIWNLVEGKFLGQTDVGCAINCCIFSSKKYWLVIGTDNGIKVWDLPAKEVIFDIKASPIDEDRQKQKKPIACTSLAWNKNSNLLFAGFSDNYIRVYKIVNLA